MSIEARIHVHELYEEWVLTLLDYELAVKTASPDAGRLSDSAHLAFQAFMLYSTAEADEARRLARAAM